MENFIVSARKYRPSIFNTVIGQQSITTTLKNSIKNNHLAHAYLFCGPRGVGKTTCARIFAKTINCTNITDKVEACNECESCKSFNKANSFNIHELDAASNNSVDGIRNLIDQVRIPPQIAKYSIYIIDEVHMLSSQAFNAFLKTLEEPPAHAIFILATTEKHKIIPTILSRCQIFDFNRIKIDDIVEHLKYVAKSENIEADTDGLTIIAQKADGALRDALSIFDQIVSFSGNKFTYADVIENLNVLDYDYYFKIVDACLQNDISSSLMLFNHILDNGFDAQNFINGLNQHFRDILVCKDAATIQLLEVGDNIKDKYKVQSVKCNLDFLYKALKILSEADINYKTSNNKRLLTELALVQLCNIIEPDGKTEKVQIEIPKVEKKLDKLYVEIPRTEEKVLKVEEPKNQEIEKPNTKQEVYKQNTFSIKDAIKDDWQEESIVEEDNEDGAYTEVELRKSVFTIDQLKSNWDKFASRFEETEKRKFLLLDKAELELSDDFIINLKINTELQKDIFEKEIKSEIIYFLKNELQNDLLSINIEIVEITEDKQLIYSDKDKYNHLVKQNPKLEDLKNNLKLDFQ